VAKGEMQCGERVTLSLIKKKKMFDINNMWIDFNCPKCQYSIDVQLVDVKLRKITFCHNCKADIQLIDESASNYSGAKRIDDAMKSLQKTLKKIGK
jgi:uncharacterized Fe-S cluster-containing protein